MNYMQNEFLLGAERQISVFFDALNALSNSNKTRVITEGETEVLGKDVRDGLSGLHSKVMTQELKIEIQQFLESLKQDHDLDFRIKLNTIDGISHRDNHLSFGTQTTLLRAPISVELAPMVYKRKYKGGYLFKEMNFEYFIQGGESEDESTPSLDTRVQMTKDLVVVGINVEAKLDFEVELLNNGEPKYFERFDKPVIFRFETEPFKGRDVGQFRICDVDNYFASKMIP